MKNDSLNTSLVRNEQKKRFEMEVEGRMSYIEYRQFGKQIILDHTEVDPELKNTDIHLTLIEKTLEWVEANSFLLLPFCPLIQSYIHTFPKWKKIVDHRFKCAPGRTEPSKDSEEGIVFDH